MLFPIFLAAQQESMPEEVLEKANKIKSHLDKNYEQHRAMQENLELESKYAISNYLVRLNAIPMKTKEEIIQKKLKIKSLIFDVANGIENDRFEEVNMKNGDFSYDSTHTKNRSETILNAQKEIYISYTSLKSAFDIFTLVNKELLDEIKRSKGKVSKKSELDLYVKNAILVYELADIICLVLDEFEIKGLDKLKEIHEETLENIGRQRKKDSKLKQDTLSRNASETIRDDTLASIKSREETRGILVDYWQNLMERMNAIRSTSEKIVARKTDFEIIRTNAEIQLEHITDLKVAQMIGSAIKAMEGFSEIKGISLAPLEIDDVHRLLGIEQLDLQKEQ